VYKKCVVLVLSLALSTSALAQESGLKRPEVSSVELLSRIDKLEKRVLGMQKQSFSGDGNSVSNANLENQLEEVYQQIKNIRGDIEELQFEQNKLNEKFMKFTADIEYRLSETSQNKNKDDIDNEKRLANIGDQLHNKDFLSGSDQEALEAKKKDGDSTSTASPSAMAEKPASSNKTPEEEYQEAYSALKERDYKRSEKLFEAFVEKNSKHPLAGNSYFWLGEISTQKSDFDNAAIRYLKGYQLSPKGTRAPDNLLKLAESLAGLHKKSEACLTLAKLSKEFPNASNTIKKKAEEKNTELKCNLDK
jgi:tol-pal system protein YbgF